MVIDIFGKKKLNDIKVELDSSMKVVKEHFQQHLDSINDNTNEIQTNYEYSCQLDNKMEKLAQRLDQIQLVLKQITNDPNFIPDIEEDYQVQQLTAKEKEVFLVLYATDNNIPLSYVKVSSSLNLTESLVKQYVTNLIEKGIPIIKEYRLGRPYIRLDAKFKDLQTKQNILNIDEKLMKQVFLRP